MTIAPTSCHDCVHLIRGTSGGQAREKHVYQSLDDNRRALLELREGYQANQVARRALMGRKA